MQGCGEWGIGVYKTEMAYSRLRSVIRNRIFNKTGFSQNKIQNPKSYFAGLGTGD